MAARKSAWKTVQSHVQLNGLPRGERYLCSDAGKIGDRHYLSGDGARVL